MSEEAAEVTEAPEVEETDDVSPPAGKTWWQFQSQEEAVEWANDKIQKRLAREKKKVDPLLEGHAKLKAEVEQLRPLKAAQQTDTERWESERTQLSTELEELRSFRQRAERDNLVREIAEDKGLPAKFLERIRGDDADTISADMDQFLTVLNDGKPTKPASRKPVDPDENSGQKGYGGGGSKSETDDKAVVDNVLKKYRANRNKTFSR